jgi:selenocysteine lyase/cysteine desulfurase
VSVAPLFDPADFRIPAGVVHVCAGGETAFLRRHDEAFHRYAEDKSNGMQGRTAQEELVERTRETIAAQWHVEASEIGFVSSVAEGVSLVAESIDWRDGDTICVDANEYPSVVGPFALQRRPKPALRLATGQGVDRWAAAADQRTRIIGVSYVSYLTGERVDLAAMRRLADSVGALLVVDFTQAAGYLPIDAQFADFAFSACYKWLLGCTGVAVAYWNRRRNPDWAPTTGGWHSIVFPPRPSYTPDLALRADALRFTRGNPPHLPIYVLASALDYLSRFDVAAVQRHVHGLTTTLIGRLERLGIPTTTPPDPARHGASVCVDSSAAQSITDALGRDGVYAWNGRGRIRFSFHGYNGAGDIERIEQSLRPAWRA